MQIKATVCPGSSISALAIQSAVDRNLTGAGR
jgi:hypothetical protein